MNNYKEENFWTKVVEILNKQEYSLNNKNENVQLVALSMLSFVVPLILKHPQILVGSFVNMMLVIAALNFRGKKLIPIIVFPSLGALAGGYLFGELTIQLFYMIPGIWLGNTLLIFMFKYFNLYLKKNFFLALGAGSIAKTIVIFIFALTMAHIGFISSKMLVAMGLMQFVTAITGGALAFTTKRLKIC